MDFRRIFLSSQDRPLSSNTFICSICKERFWMRSKYLNHVSSHKKFLCYLCQKSFYYKRALNLHCLTHVDEINSRNILTQQESENKDIHPISIEKESSIENLKVSTMRSTVTLPPINKKSSFDSVKHKDLEKITMMDETATNQTLSINLNLPNIPLKRELPASTDSQNSNPAKHFKNDSLNAQMGILNTKSENVIRSVLTDHTYSINSKKAETSDFTCGIPKLITPPSSETSNADKVCVPQRNEISLIGEKSHVINKNSSAIEKSFEYCTHKNIKDNTNSKSSLNTVNLLVRNSLQVKKISPICGKSSTTSGTKCISNSDGDQLSADNFTQENKALSDKSVSSLYTMKSLENSDVQESISLMDENSSACNAKYMSNSDVAKSSAKDNKVDSICENLNAIADTKSVSDLNTARSPAGENKIPSMGENITAYDAVVTSDTAKPPFENCIAQENISIISENLNETKCVFNLDVAKSSIKDSVVEEYKIISLDETFSVKKDAKTISNLDTIKSSVNKSNKIIRKCFVRLNKISNDSVSTDSQKNSNSFNKTRRNYRPKVLNLDGKKKMPAEELLKRTAFSNTHQISKKYPSSVNKSLPIGENSNKTLSYQDIDRLCSRHCFVRLNNIDFLISKNKPAEAKAERKMPDGTKRNAFSKMHKTSKKYPSSVNKSLPNGENSSVNKPAEAKVVSVSQINNTKTLSYQDIDRLYGRNCFVSLHKFDSLISINKPAKEKAVCVRQHNKVPEINNSLAEESENIIHVKSSNTITSNATETKIKLSNRVLEIVKSKLEEKERKKEEKYEQKKKLQLMEKALINKCHKVNLEKNSQKEVLDSENVGEILENKSKTTSIKQF